MVSRDAFIAVYMLQPQAAHLAAPICTWRSSPEAVFLDGRDNSPAMTMRRSKHRQRFVSLDGIDQSCYQFCHYVPMRPALTKERPVFVFSAGSYLANTAQNSEVVAKRSVHAGRRIARANRSRAFAADR
jgi:hypothetical protein